MAHAGARVPKVAKHRVCVTTQPRPTTSLHTKETSEDGAGYLASIAFGD
jgi:hypothetical protein